MDPRQICISTSGVRANPPWLDGLLARGCDLCCGLDADGPGDAAAARMTPTTSPSACGLCAGEIIAGDSAIPERLC